jgi:hypothetical protein
MSQANPCFSNGRLRPTAGGAVDWPALICWGSAGRSPATRDASRQDKQELGKRDGEFERLLCLCLRGVRPRRIYMPRIVGVQPDLVRPGCHALRNHMLCGGLFDPLVERALGEFLGFSRASTALAASIVAPSGV